MVAHRGFEPLISALRGRCPGPLDECAVRNATARTMANPIIANSAGTANVRSPPAAWQFSRFNVPSYRPPTVIPATHPSFLRKQESSPSPISAVPPILYLHAIKPPKTERHRQNPENPPIPQITVQKIPQPLMTPAPCPPEYRFPKLYPTSGSKPKYTAHRLTHRKFPNQEVTGGSGTKADARNPPTVIPAQAGIWAGQGHGQRWNSRTQYRKPKIAPAVAPDSLNLPRPQTPFNQ